MVSIRPFVVGAGFLLMGLFVPSQGAWAQADDQMCLMCHGDPAMLAGVEGAERLLVTPDDLAGSVHGVAGIGCTLCHQNLPFPHTAVVVPPVDCAACHSTQGRQHAASLHGQAAARGDALAPSCEDCHGGHDILSHRNPHRILRFRHYRPRSRQRPRRCCPHYRPNLPENPCPPEWRRNSCGQDFAAETVGPGS